MEEVFHLLIVAVIFATFYGVIKLVITRKERLTLIEKGTNMPETKSQRKPFSTVKLGIFLTGIGLGILIANILTITTKLENDVAYFSMVFLFGGISLIIAHLIERGKKEN